MAEWERMCLAKRRYPDEPLARCGAMHCMERDRDRGLKPIARLWVYRCPNCRGWHMTSAGFLNQGAAPVTITNLYAPVRR